VLTPWRGARNDPLGYLIGFLLESVAHRPDRQSGAKHLETGYPGRLSPWNIGMAPWWLSAHQIRVTARLDYTCKIESKLPRTRARPIGATSDARFSWTVGRASRYVGLDI
jgi:hypothetical protein